MRALHTSRLSYGPLSSLQARRRLRVLGAAAAVLLGGCAAPPPKPVVTPVEVTLSAAANANPDAQGRASPLTVRLYVLKSPGAFNGADFFSLYDKDTATLGAELVQREDMLLRPGESRKLSLTLAPEAKAIGVLAAYRDLEHARWRALQPLDVGKPMDLTVRLEARQIRLEAK